MLIRFENLQNKEDKPTIIPTSKKIRYLPIEFDEVILLSLKLWASINNPTTVEIVIKMN